MQDRELGLAHKLIGNTLYNVLAQAYVMLLSFAVVPYVVHRLGAGLYGLLAIVATLGGFGSLFNIGLGNALAKFTSELYWQRELRLVRDFFQTGVAISLFGGLTSFLLLIGFRKTMSAALFHGDPAVEPVVHFALWITAFGLLLAPVTESLSAIPMGLQRFDVYNRVTVLMATVRNGGMVLALALGFRIRAVLLVNVFSSLVNALGYFYYGRKLVPHLSLRPKLMWSHLKQLVWYSGSVLIAGAAALVVHRLDRVLVAYFLPISAVAFYVVPYSLAEKTGIAVANITPVVLPSASELRAKGEQRKLSELYVRASKTVILVSLPVTSILFVFSPQILKWWVGPEFSVNGALTLRLLALGFLFNILGYVPFVVAQGIGRPWISAKFSLTNGIANLALFLVLIPRFGIVGAAAGFLLSQILITPFLIWETNRALGVSWGTVILRSYARPFACGLMAFGIFWLLQPYASSVRWFVVLGALGLLAYGILAFAGATDDRERMAIYEEVLHILRTSWKLTNV